jgi:REP element-mobilizing transposase RayT
MLSKNIRKDVFNHIRENGKSKGIYIDHINGYVEHVHCLISLKSDQNLATIMNLLKGESSHWINKNKLTKKRFSWQTEYFAASVSHSAIDRVRKYIRNQEAHHTKKPFEEEYNEFIEKYGFELIPDADS